MDWGELLDRGIYFFITLTTAKKIKKMQEQQIIESLHLKVFSKLGIRVYGWFYRCIESVKLQEERMDGFVRGGVREGGSG